MLYLYIRNKKQQKTINPIMNPNGYGVGDYYVSGSK